jgi:uncharacterized repeat protein (TIGR02543 family)
MLLAMCMVVIMLPVPSMAEETYMAISDSGEIINFAPLIETEKTVSTGISIEDLGLPETLTATVRTAVTPREDSLQDSGRPVVQDSGNPDTDTLTDNSEIAPSTTATESEWLEETQKLSVTWTSQPEYDRNTEGEYVFTPVIAGYTVSAELPEIKVTVGVVAARVMMLTAGTSIEISTFANLQSVINNAKSNLHLKLSDSYTESIGTLTIASGNNYNITIDLNGKTLDGGSNSAIAHYGSGTLTIIDSSDDKGGIVTIAASSSYTSTVISLEGASSSLVIDGSRVSAHSGSTIIRQKSGSSVHVLDGIVENTFGHAIVCRSYGTVNISGGIVRSLGTSGKECNAILDLLGDVYVSGGIVSSATSNGISVNYSKKVIIPSGSPVIQGGNSAMSAAPDLSSYFEAKVTASINYDGNDPVAIYDPANINDYKYFRLDETMAVKNTDTGAIYHSLQAAVNAITVNNQTVQLLDNITLTNSLTIAEDNNKSFTIDLNGKTLISNAWDSAINHNGSGTLTITDKSSGGGKLTTNARMTIHLNGGRLTVDSGTVENTGSSTAPVSFSAIYNEKAGKITISGTAAVTCETGAAISLSDGTADTTILEISGGTIRSTEGTAINDWGTAKIIISGGSPVISGGYMAMKTVPDLSSFGDVKVTASGNFDGSFPEHTYYPYEYNLKTYKYLKFESAPDIARIGDNVYTKLQSAVDAITDNGQTIDLLGNVNIAFSVVIDSENDKSFTLNLNGYTINSNIRTAITHNGSGTLTITDNSTEGSGVVTSIHDFGYTVLLNGGSLIVSGGTVQNTGDLSTCSAISNEGDGSVSVVSNGVVKSYAGSAIYNYRAGKITISDNAKVTGASRSVSNSGTIYLHSWKNYEDILLEINGGTIENTDNGYAIYNRADGKIAITGGAPVIKGGYMATNRAPDLSYYPYVNVVASKYVEGTPRIIYNKNDIFYYKHLAFAPPAVAAKNKTTGVDYFAVQTAVDAASDGDTIALQDDIAFVAPLKIALKDNASLTLDLNGKTLESAITYTCETSGGKLIIDDTAGGGKITSALSSFSSGTILARGGSASTAILEIKGGTVENTDNTRLNFGDGGNAICNVGCTVNVTGGTVVSSSGGAAILNANAYPYGILNVSGGTVKNTSKYNCAAIYNAGSGTVSVSGGTVDGGVGIAIHNESQKKIVISGTALVTGTIGVNLLRGELGTTALEITGGTVESPVADGVAIRNMSLSNVRVLDGVVRGTAENAIAIRNYSGGNTLVLGGAVRATAENTIAIHNSGAGNTIISDGTVENTAVGMAIYHSGWSSIEISGGMVHAENGNAISNEGKDVLLSGGTVSATVGTAISAVYAQIKDGTTAIIYGGDMAMDTDLELELSIKVTASTNVDGSSPVTVYNPAKIKTYKYLKFETNTDTTVTDLNLSNKLTVPATGDIPEEIILDTAQYSGTVTWSGNPTKFLGSTAYTATVSLTAKDGYTFFGVAQRAFTHDSATSIYHGAGARNTLTATIWFPQTAARTLESITITTPPTKTAYYYGETFDKTGMVVKAIYNDETEGANFTDYLVDKTEPLTLSDTTITLTASGTSIKTAQIITVSKKTPTVDDLIFSLTAVDYDGNAKPLSIEANPRKTLGAITVKYNGGITAPTDAGNYTITVDIAESAEYNAVAGLSLGSYVIKKIGYTGTTTVYTSVFTSGQAGATVILPTLPAGASYGTPVAGSTITLTDMSIAGTTLTYTAPVSTAGQTGTMSIPVTGATNYNNYNIVVTVTYKAKASQGISYAMANVAKTYGDITFVNPLAQTVVDGTITYASDDTLVATVNPSTGEVTIIAIGDGNATITATVAETGTHAQATASYTVTVAKKALTLKADDKSMTKGDGLPDFTYTVTGLVNGDTVITAPTLSTETDGDAVGTFDITISGGVVENAESYDMTDTKGTLTVSERLFTATVTNGTGSGSYAEGAIVTITANDRSGYTFIGWSGEGVTFADAAEITTTFTMPANAVTVTANYRQNGSGSDGGGSEDGSGGGSDGNSDGSSGGGSDSGSGGDGGESSSNDNSGPIIITPPMPDKLNSPTQGEIKVPATVDHNGNITVNITDKTVSDAFDNALADAKKNGSEQNGVTVVLRVNTGSKTGSNVTVNLPKTVQDTIIAKKIVNTIVVVDNPNIRIGMDLATVQEINKQAKSDVNITATRTDSSRLTGEAKQAIGSRPVFDLKVNYGSGKQVQSFSAGSVLVTIPYTLGANEKAGNVQAVYVDSNGNVHWLVNSVYDSVEKVLRFSTSHFSTYGIGYKQTNTAFTDIAGHWAKEDIEFVVSRGLFGGRSATTFGPNTAMTRGMLVTALARLANADVSGYPKSSFTDVKNDAYYMGYIGWASKNSIVNGVGDNKFAPDQSITREQMAVILQNYAKAIGFTLPKVHKENTFADSAKISAYAKDAVKQAQMAGIISGKNGNLFDPQGTATRAEVSAMLRRFVQLAVSGDALQGWTRNDSGLWMYYKSGKPVTGNKEIGGTTYTFDQYGVTADVPKNLRYATYIVQKGDSFWLIAHKLSCTMADLESLNNKSRFTSIHPGDVLKVPEK